MYPFSFRLYRNNLKSREFDKEAPQNFCPERATIAERQGASEDENFEGKPTPSKTDSSSCFGICALFAICGIFADDLPIENQETFQEIPKCVIDYLKGCESHEFPKETCGKNPPKWEISADLLFWRANQIATWAVSLLDAHTNFLTEDTADAAQNNVLFDWSTGFRGGASRSLNHDFWDMQFFYTWFHTQKKEKALGFAMISSFLGNWLSFGIDPFLQPIAGTIQWAISLNMFDWRLSRNCFVSRTISFQPSLGIKGGGIHQNIHSHWQLISESSTENLKNNFWGVGPQLGLNTHWHLLQAQNRSFYLFGDGAFALLGGCWTFKDKQKTTANLAISSFNIPSKTYAGTFMLQGLMGLGLDVYANKNNLQVSLKLGLETQVWFDQLKIFTFLEGTLHNILMLQGGTLDLAFSF